MNQLPGGAMLLVSAQAAPVLRRVQADTATDCLACGTPRTLLHALSVGASGLQAGILGKARQE